MLGLRKYSKNYFFFTSFTIFGIYYKLSGSKSKYVRKK
jgi:hypothetical protein